MIIGIDPKTLDYQFHTVPKHMDSCVAKTVEDPLGRFLSHPASRPFLVDRFGADHNFKWDDPHGWGSWRDIPFETMIQVFSLEECCRLWYDSVIESKVSRHIEKNYKVLHKLQNVHWRYDYQRDSWNTWVRHLKGLGQLDFGLPNFDVRLIHSTGSNTSSHSQQIRDLYIDAAFGLVVYYKTEHVLTVGFAPTARGILITQIQLRRKKGNRFLYSLPTHYVDQVLEVFQTAFPDDSLCLVEGASAAVAVRNAYGTEGLPETFTPEVEAHIASVYNRELVGHARSQDSFTADRRTYNLLIQKQSFQLAA